MQAKKTQRWEMVLLHEDIPCNLAPAHFMVHIAYAAKLRSRGNTDYIIARSNQRFPRFLKPS